MKVAIFPGSFDPITVGHIDLIERSIFFKAKTELVKQNFQEI